MLGVLVFFAIAIPIAVIVVWMVLDRSFVRIEPGQLGLLLVRGRATTKSLLPGPHYVPTFRRRQVAVYPSNELSYRAGDLAAPDSQDAGLERGGPALRVSLGDRTSVVLSYTVRVRLDPQNLHVVHERFGSDGLWSAVRDITDAVVRSTLADPEYAVTDLLGADLRQTQHDLSEAVRTELEANGFQMAKFALADLDLGRTGEVIQSVARAPFELEREQAQAATSLARVRNDEALAPHVGPASDVALRYRELDAWRELAQSPEGKAPMPVPARAPSRPAPAEELPIVSVVDELEAEAEAEAAEQPPAEEL